jgi:regulatory protein
VKPTYSLRSRAIGYLARREHSRAELMQKLAPHAEEESEVIALLDDLMQRGYLSDARFAAEFVRAKSRRFGVAHIRYALREKGVAQELISAALSTLDDGELERARVVWQTKFATPPVNLAERAKQTRFLIGRGFSGDVIRRILRDQMED